jgi:hypothetical protein
MNLSFSINSIHIHNTNKRTYDKGADKVSGKYAYCLPVTLMGETKSKNINRLYFLVRRKYYLAIVENRLDGFGMQKNNLIIPYLSLFYYKLRIKLNG